MVKKQEELKIQHLDFTQKIKDISEKVQTFKEAVDSHKRSAQAAVEHSDRIFSELIRSLHEKRAEVRELISTKEENEIGQINDHIQKLDQEISNLKRENDKLKLILHTEDHIHFFQNYSSQSGLYVCTASPGDVNDLVTFQNVEESVSELNSQLVQLFEKHMAKISKKVADVHIFKPTRLQVQDIYSTSTSESESDSELPNYSSQSGLYVYTTSPRDVNDLLTFENVEESVSELKSQLVNLCKEHMARISKKVADVQISKTSWLQDMDSPEASASYHSSDDECFFSPVLSDPEDETE
ncbi:hypothetical protein Q8A67_010763 [Cirrhinus molitorella]|uniref:TRIM8/14/16/25/29/45/65 coiled-coil region domain-containing protein n=1 Tax=Cirrhinus molitorella TaxID=172907 RepID=A0AA88PPG7_9TELE|nr:hypothetical protein Q8A67_010763 [Cirrhinus molitorella]